MSNEILRIGLIGCGEVAEHKHMPALRGIDGARVTAVADIDERQRATWRRGSVSSMSSRIRNR
jgi:predicted dehydrogenase